MWAPYGYRTYANEPPKVISFPAKGQKVPYACIRSRHPSGVTLCDRHPDDTEFVFQDAEHAAEAFVDNRGVAVCNKCASKVTK